MNQLKTSIVDAKSTSHDQFLIKASRKESKRLLKIAKSNNGLLSIQQLHDAQEIIARLKGKDSWRSLASNAEEVNHQPTELNSNPFMTILDDYGYYAKEISYDVERMLINGENQAIWTAKKLKFDFNELIDGLNKELSLDVKAIVMKGFLFSTVLQVHVYSALTSAILIKADGLKEHVQSNKMSGAKHDFVALKNKARMNNANLLSMIKSNDYASVRDYLASQCGALLVNNKKFPHASFNELRWSELVVIAMLSAGICQEVSSFRLRTMLYTGENDDLILLEAKDIIFNCTRTKDWGSIDSLMDKHLYVSTFILGLDKLSPTGRKFILPCLLIRNKDPLLWWSIVDCTGDSCGIAVAGIITRHLYEAYSEFGADKRMDIVTRNLMHGMRFNPDRETVDLLPQQIEADDHNDVKISWTSSIVSNLKSALKIEKNNENN